jgi:hypothetical protein
MAETFAMVATAVTATNAVTIIDSSFASINLIRSIYLHNAHTSNTAALTVSVSRLSTNDIYVVAAYTQVASQQTIQVLPEPLVLNNNDTLRVTCDPVDSVNVVASYLKIDT